eukprot:gb/GECG01011037.1/.p1 GENE.gb/GECG01011037.1/~~gb/GECG01011037.1/.p1  ORF type:complete len:214 (+),score=23.12 gb/GECG01011037.1/:1-642(+)
MMVKQERNFGCHGAQTTTSSGKFQCPRLRQGSAQPQMALTPLAIGILQFAGHTKAPKSIPLNASTSFSLHVPPSSKRRTQAGKRRRMEVAGSYVEFPFAGSKSRCCMSQQPCHFVASDESESTISDSTSATNFTAEEAASELLRLNRHGDQFTPTETSTESPNSVRSGGLTNMRAKRRYDRRQYGLYHLQSYFQLNVPQQKVGNRRTLQMQLL